MALELAWEGGRGRGTGPTQKPKAAIFKLNLWSIYATKEEPRERERKREEEAKEYANKKQE